MEQAIYWLWFADLFGRGTRLSHEMLEFYGSAEAVFQAGEAELRQTALLTRPQVEQVLRHDLGPARRQYEAALKEGCRLLTPEDEEYPDCLRHIYAPPAVLFLHGSLSGLEEHPAVAVVGSRRSDEYGLTTAARLSEELAAAGVSIISGLAMGIDQAAHRAAIKAEGVTIGVLGCGIELDYPKGTRPLREMMAEKGAVLTEYPVGEPARPGNFPMRNRIISGLSRGVLVVRADEYSGSLITAGHALSQGRDVFAVPGGIDAPLSQGPNGLIRRGEAKLIQDAWDVVEEYAALYPDKLHPKTPLAPGAARARLEGRESPPPAPPQQKEPAPARLVVDLGKDPEALTDDQAALLRALQARGEQSADDLVEATGIPARRVLSALTLLQVRQWVAEAGRRFTTLVELKEERTHPPRG